MKLQVQVFHRKYTHLLYKADSRNIKN